MSTSLRSSPQKNLNSSSTSSTLATSLRGKEEPSGGFGRSTFSIPPVHVESIESPVEEEGIESIHPQIPPKINEKSIKIKLQLKSIHQKAVPFRNVATPVIEKRVTRRRGISDSLPNASFGGIDLCPSQSDDIPAKIGNDHTVHVHTAEEPRKKRVKIMNQHLHSSENVLLNGNNVINPQNVVGGRPQRPFRYSANNDNDKESKSQSLKEAVSFVSFDHHAQAQAQAHLNPNGSAGLKSSIHPSLLPLETQFPEKKIVSLDDIKKLLESFENSDGSDLSDLDHLVYPSTDNSSSEDEADKDSKPKRSSGRTLGTGKSAASIKKKTLHNNTQASGTLTQKEQLINPFSKKNGAYLMLNEEEIKQDLEIIRRCWAPEEPLSSSKDNHTSVIGPNVPKIGLATVAPTHGRRSALSAMPSPYKGHQAIENNDYCSACLGIGELLCCDTCPRVFHFSCVAEGYVLGEREPAETWQCRSCISRYGRINISKPCIMTETPGMLKKSISNDNISLPDPDDQGQEVDDEMNLDDEENEQASALKFPLFKHLFKQMDALNPRVYQLPLSIRNAFQNVVSHPITGDYLDTHDTFFLKSSGGSFGGRSMRKSVLSDNLIADNSANSLVESLNNLETLQASFNQSKDPQNDQQKSKHNRSLCFKCCKSDQLDLQPAPLLTHSFPTTIKGIVGHSQSFRTNLITCDYCKQHWHLDCLDPPLATIPLPLRQDEWSPIDLLAYAQLHKRIRGTPGTGSGSGSGWRPFHPLDQPLHPIPPVLGLNKQEGDEYSTSDVHLLCIASPESRLFEQDRYLLIRPKWMCPLHAEWASPFPHQRVPWTLTAPAWKIYKERAGEIRQARLESLQREIEAQKKKLEVERMAQWEMLKKKGFVHVDYDASSTAAFEPLSVPQPESKFIIDFTEKVGWLHNEKSKKIGKSSDKEEISKEKPIDDTQPAHKGPEDQNESASSIIRISELLENANISLRKDMYRKFQEYGSEWSSVKVNNLYDMTVGPDLDKFIPLVDHLVQEEVHNHRHHDQSNLQESAAALLLFQLELQDRFAERHLGLYPDQA